MTVRYSKDVATGRRFPFVRLLFRWHGSFYKLILYEFVIYFLVYLTLNIVKSYVLTHEQEEKFSEICAQLGGMSGYVFASITFCLGFFIQQVYKRFCYHFQIVPWPDGFAFLVSVNVRGHDMRGRLLRRTMVRYTVASIILTWIDFSEQMKVLFPDLESLVVAGFLTENELLLMKSVSRPAWKHMVAASWCAAVVKRARLENRIEDDHALSAILEELENIRSKCSRLVSHNNRPTPLAYFHTVIIGVCSFFWIAAIAGSYRQQTQHLYSQLKSENDPGDRWMLGLLSQAVTMLQFAICSGVLAISRSLLTPFGTDDSNINVIEIVKRHLSLAYLIVDELHSIFPEIQQTDNNGRQTSIFQIGDGGFSTQIIHRHKKKKNPNTENVYGKEDLGYQMSVAPRQVSASQEKTEIPPSYRSRRILGRLLSFRRLNASKHTVQQHSL